MMRYTYEELLPVFVAKAASWNNARLAYEVSLLPNCGDSWASPAVMEAWTKAVNDEAAKREARKTPTVTAFEQARALLGRGYYIGPRNPNRNRSFKGLYMVCENASAPDSDDASNDEFCIVGDNLAELVQEAYRANDWD